MSQDKLVTEIRSEFGKGAARRLRAAGKIPAVLYGHGTDPKHLALPAHETFLLVRYANAIIDLNIEGDSQLALVKDVQRNPIMMGADAIEHIDLIIVKRGEKVEVEVSVHLEGESAPGTINNLETPSLLLEVDALNIPDAVTVSIEGLEEGASIVAGEIDLPKGATLVTDPEQYILGIIVPQLETESDADAEAPAEGDIVPEEGDQENE